MYINIIYLEAQFRLVYRLFIILQAIAIQFFNLILEWSEGKQSELFLSLKSNSLTNLLCNEKLD